MPLMAAAILKDADFVRAYWRCGKVWNDNGDVALARDHWIGLVGDALERTAGMGVHVRHDGQGFLAAHAPQL